MFNYLFHLLCYMLSLCSKITFFLLHVHVHTYACPLEHQRVSLFSVVCIFECFSLNVLGMFN